MPSLTPPTDTNPAHRIEPPRPTSGHTACPVGQITPFLNTRKDETPFCYVRLMVNEGEVVDEAIRAAWDSYRVLEKRTPAKERQQAQERVRAAMNAYGCEEVSRGTVFLVGVLTGFLIAEQDSRKDRMDPLSDLIPAVIRRLPTFEKADPAQVPMVTGVLMAAAMGMDTVAWRDQFGQIPPKEALVHTFVLWLLADLFDSMTERPGAIDQLMRGTFDSAATGNS